MAKTRRNHLSSLLDSADDLVSDIDQALYSILNELDEAHINRDTVTTQVHEIMKLLGTYGD